MLDFLLNIDKQLLLFLNSLQTPFLNIFMWQFSKILIWTPLFLFLLWKLWKAYKYNIFYALIALVVLVFITDQFCNGAKFFFQRLRPTHSPEIGELVKIVNNYRGGYYGFYSGHAANSFAVATFLYSILFLDKKWIRWLPIVFAVLTSYSRIYLGVHYPGDIIVGAAIGTLTGFIMAKAFKFFNVVI